MDDLVSGVYARIKFITAPTAAAGSLGLVVKKKNLVDDPMFLVNAVYFGLELVNVNRLGIDTN
jgi:hypothetical protein